MAANWYKHVEADAPLTQGDLITDCPIITWASSEIIRTGAEDAEALKAATRAIKADVVVMTQACDLENRKITNLILCPHLSLTEYRSLWEERMRDLKQNATPRAWKSTCDDICNGYVWNLTMLDSGESGPLKIEHRVVDFRDVYTIPVVFLESLLRQRGTPRLSLLSPYREHLSQAFARFFMRVGLPSPVSPTW
jgi:hypothetical protein